MKETIKSLGVYFFIIGILVAVIELRVLLIPPVLVFDNIFELVGLFFGLMFIYIAVNLKKLLAHSPNFVLNILIGVLIMYLVIYLIYRGSLFPLLVRVLIGLYLIVNVKRLSKEISYQ